MGSFQSRPTSIQEGSTRAEPTNLGFASLPAELRNNTYAQTLRWKGPVTLTYDETSRRFQTPRACLVEGRTPLQALEVLSSLDHYIRREARSYFFANNFIEIKTRQKFTSDPDYVQVYIHFLENIGETGRWSLRHLRLTVSEDSSPHRPKFEQALKLWSLLADCMNLERLDLFLEVDYFYMDQCDALKSHLSTLGFPVSQPWLVVLQSLRHLENLKRLSLQVVFSSRWRHIEVNVHTRATATGLREPKAFKRVRFQVKRPIDEAAELVDQVKGVLRQGLRRRVAIQVSPTETWDQYGADLTFGRTSKGSDNLVLCGARRFKPQERRFNYSNGFREQ
ncbi:uncharacterized protein K460DRAFT_314067 [Cucurbitaria berberidis CBS 394.84]|uniref:Uncharacterized protein n=1 Tax=Cucurbitaria berberidis CBS 394.84 TaxID=1168544 RepID=A0A9P4GJ44_9PLEO|nr:uncharacterized protein K460DRAFT_314067 [Cucurbitaria berberidis CBS 394.84]KAF1846540.1 hypothetical protein K460DRAFT_314067 [Cucurbitaria berberidis CBS 394.84]